MKQRQQRSVQRLRCSVQNYDWGKKGPDSEVARLYASNSASEIDPEKPYAEFWMGTHDSGPSFLIHQDLNGLSSSLKHWVSTNPNELLGHKVVQKWGSDLPFLFKVLLSILSWFSYPFDSSKSSNHSIKSCNGFVVVSELGAFCEEGIVDTGTPG